MKMASCVVGLLLTGAASAQPVLPTQSLMEQLRQSEQAVTNARLQPENKGRLFGTLQTYGNVLSFAGDAEGAMAALDEGRKAAGVPVAGSAAEVVALTDVHAEDAIRAIVAAARDKRAVLINEAHHQPMNRALTQKLAAELRKIGYTYLACETFYPAVSAQPRYATAARGYYVQEPAFASFVNQAIASGWTLVPYEHIQDASVTDQAQRAKLREAGQASNIYERIFARDPEAKVLIHVGYGHLDKTSPGALKKMGTLLAEKLGPNATLHVDQAALFAHADRTRESPAYRPLLAKFAATEPFILQRADGSTPVLLNQSRFVDMQVIFPDYGHQHGRPAWLIGLAGRTASPVPATLLPATGRRLVLAYDKAHGADALAVDAVLVQAGQPAPSLMLPPGEMRLETQE